MRERKKNRGEVLLRKEEERSVSLTREKYRTSPIPDDEEMAT